MALQVTQLRQGIFDGCVGRDIFALSSGYGNVSADLCFGQSLISKFFMLITSIRFSPLARNASDLRASLHILSSHSESTSIYSQPTNDARSIIVDRSNSSAAAATTPGIITSSKAGQLRLFDLAARNSSSTVETLDLTVLVDNSIVEVYANDCFTQSIWVWSWYDESTEITFIHEGSEEIRFGPTKILFEGLVDPWPLRP